MRFHLDVVLGDQSFSAVQFSSEPVLVILHVEYLRESVRERKGGREGRVREGRREKGECEGGEREGEGRV